MSEREPPERCEVVVVGAGLAGLAAAWELRERDVVVLESEPRVGGRIRSEPREPYWLNWGAHVFGGPGSAAARLIAAAGAESTPVPGELAAVALGGRVFAGGRVETLPLRLPLRPAERLALVRAGARLRLAVRRYDRVVRERPDETLAFMGDHSFADFLGRVPPTVESLFRPTITRSSAEPEELAAGHGVGYFHLVWRPGEGLSRNVVGGSSRLTEGIAAALGERVATGAAATAVEPQAASVRVRYAWRGEERVLEAASAVVATPAHAAAELVRGLPAATEAALRRIPYGPYVVVAFLTRETEPQPWDRLYALATPGRSFNMVFNLASVARAAERERRPGGSLMVYSGGRRLTAPLLERSDEAILETYVAEFDELFPGFRGLVAEAVVQRWPRALPYPFPGRHRLQEALTAPLGRVHLAGDYLGSWYTETAAATGAAAGRAALAQLG